MLNQLSDHLPCFTLLETDIAHNSKTKFTRIFKQNDDVIQQIKNEINSSELHKNLDTSQTANPNASYNVIMNVIETARKKHMTGKFVKFNKYKHKKSKWITYGILKSIRFRDNLYKKLKLTNPVLREYEILYINLQTYNKILKRSIRVAKQLFLESTFNRYKFDIRNTWKTINEILSGNHKTTCFPNSLSINGNEITNQLHIAKEFNVFFTNIGLNLSNHIAYSGEKDCEYYLKDNINCKFALNKVDEQYVSKIIDNLPNKASCGFDNISTLFLKQISPTIITPMTLLINQVFNTGIFPERLKLAKVIPVFKKGDSKLINNYRPISLLPVISKVLEKIIANQLSKYFEDNKLFNDNQYGFRTGLSTEYATIELTYRIISNMDRNEIPFSIFLDLSKAFDTLDHSILLQKLNHYGIDGKAIQLCESYLTNRTQYVEINGVKSGALPITTGVPQGSILGPLFFIIYINDFSFASKAFTFISYADDTTLFSTVSNFTNTPNTDANCMINQELFKINEWLEINKLSLNIAKTKYMLFQHNKKVNTLTPKIINTIIEKVEEFNFLGLTLDTHVNWKKHTEKVSNKCSRIIGILNRLKHTLPQRIKIMLYNSLLLPHINYCLTTWGYHCHRLQKLQKRAIRIITLSKYNDHTAPLFKKLNLLTIKDILALQELKLYYKFIHNNVPPYIQQWQIKQNTNIHSHYTRNQNEFYIVGTKHAFAKQCLKNNFPNTLNATPQIVKDKLLTHSFYGFTNYVKNNFIQNYQIICTVINCYTCMSN